MRFLKVLTDHVDEDGAVLHGHDAWDLEGVVQPVVLRPRHELDLGVRLDVAVHHAGQAARDDLVWRSFSVAVTIHVNPLEHIAEHISL